MNKQLRFSKKTKLIIATIVITALLVGLGTAVVTVATFFDHNRLVFHSPIEIAFFQPVKVEERKPEIVYQGLEYPKDLQNLTPIQDYIVKKFGVENAKIALAVAKAESKMVEDALNVNPGSVDIGIFQINSVHYGRPGCSLREVIDQYKNVDCAYQIWKEQGWTPWVAFNNGNFKTHL